MNALAPIPGFFRDEAAGVDLYSYLFNLIGSVAHLSRDIYNKDPQPITQWLIAISSIVIILLVLRLYTYSPSLIPSTHIAREWIRFITSTFIIVLSIALLIIQPLREPFQVSTPISTHTNCATGYGMPVCYRQVSMTDLESWFANITKESSKRPEPIAFGLSGQSVWVKYLCSGGNCLLNEKLQCRLGGLIDSEFCSCCDQTVDNIGKSGDNCKCETTHKLDDLISTCCSGLNLKIERKRRDL